MADAPLVLSKSKENDSLIILDLDIEHLSEAFDFTLKVLREEGELQDERVYDAIYHKLQHSGDAGPDRIENGVAIYYEKIDGVGPVSMQVFVRLKNALEDLKGDKGYPVKYMWILGGDQVTHPYMAHALEVAMGLQNPKIRKAFDEAKTRKELEAYEEIIFKGEGHQVPEELRRTGKIGGAFMADIRRKLPHYVSDFTDGLNGKSIASIFFLFFACLAPAVAFGGLLSVLTEGSLGAVEMIVATAICGTIYALFSGQPLTILGSTGPVIIFMGILYSLCVSFNIPFLPTLAWVGLWTMVMLLIAAFTDACSYIHYFTRFTDDVFAALISIIFIVEAVKDMIGGFSEEGIANDSALLSLLLGLGTFGIGRALARMRNSPYARRIVREFLADFGPTIAILIMTIVAFMMKDVSLETLAVPSEFATTSGRDWLVNPLEAPTWVWAASIVPALLVTILLYLDQNITVRLVTNPEFKLKKGSGYHLDLAIVALLVGVCSMFGLPWMVAATVRSLNHVRSLNQVSQRDGKEVITGTVETRTTGLLVHLAVGVSLLFLGLLKQVPMSVLFGLFLYMGVASMKGNQFFERIELWLRDPARYPSTYYLRAVPTNVVHKYTAIQAICLGLLWIVKVSAAAILFPLFIAILVPIRFMLNKYFDHAHLALLDAEEQPEEEMFREVD